MDYQETIIERMPKIEDSLNRFGWDSSKKCIRAMINYGLEEVKLTSEELNLFKRKTRPIWDTLAGKLYPRELLNEVLDYLEEYHLNKAVNQDNVHR